MAFDGKPPLGKADARLLKVLRARYGTDTFDECHVSIHAPGDPQLLRALGFLGVKVNRARRSLNYTSHEVVARWLKRVEGQRADGLYLSKDGIGWFSIQAVGLAPTGCTGPAG